MDKITVGVVNWNSATYIADLFQSLKNKVTDSELKFIVCDNTGGQDTKLYETLGETCEIVPFNPEIPQVRRRERRAGSYAHALGLNMLLSRVTTEFCLFIDPDCLILTKGWDVACKTALTNQFIAVGTPYHLSKIPKYHNFPAPIFTFFQTSTFRNIRVDWTPYMLPLSVYIWDQIMRIPAILGGRLGERLLGQSFHATQIAEWMRWLFGNSSKDTGWRLPNRVHKHGYAARLFTPAVATWQLNAEYQENTAVTNLMNEFELFLWQGIPLVTHYYGVRHRKMGNPLETTRKWKELAASVTYSCASTNIQTLGQPQIDTDTIYL